MITVDGDSIFRDTDESPSMYSIGWGLSGTARFAGQTRIWYPVLAHMICAYRMSSQAAGALALLHDAAESIVGDQVTTWKNDLTKQDEDMLLERILDRLGLVVTELEWEEVRRVDAALLAAEALLLGHSDPDHPHFKIVREELPELYQIALEHTSSMIGKISPVTTSRQKYANLFVSLVDKAVSESNQVVVA